MHPTCKHLRRELRQIKVKTELDINLIVCPKPRSAAESGPWLMTNYILQFCVSLGVFKKLQHLTLVLLDNSMLEEGKNG